MKYLFVVAHPDDEVLGAGAVIYKLIREGNADGSMVLDANQACWAGPPLCPGLYIRVVPDSEAQRLMFEKGELDIIDLDNMGADAEYFFHGDIYQPLLAKGNRVGISYIALNESIEPLNDVRVRRALQLALNRQTLLDAAYSGRENFLISLGRCEEKLPVEVLKDVGNPDLASIPYSLADARALLDAAGLEDGFSLTITLADNAGQSYEELVALVASMWRYIGVRVNVDTVSEDEFIARRKRGEVACYTSTWSADFNDPDNFIYTFFGSEENTKGRSLCYGDPAVIERVQNARAIVDDNARITEYQALERKIVQEDAAWIPLFSKQHIFVASSRVEGFRVSWNGWSSNNYRNVSVKGQ